MHWLMYILKKENNKIQHALQGGEFQLGPYFLDSYAKTVWKPTAFEFNDCFCYGCVTCYNKKAWNPMMRTTYTVLHY